MKVSGPETKPQKTLPKQLEGAGQQLRKSSYRPPSERKKGKNHESDLINRLVTRMVSSPRFPPAYLATPTRSITRRFVSAPTIAISSNDFTLSLGHRQFLVVVSTGGLAVPWVDEWRIKAITVWCTSYVDNPTTCEIRPNFTDAADNCFNDKDSTYACSSRSEAEAGHMKIIPARDTPLGSWHKTSTLNSAGSLFDININNGGASTGNWATTTLDLEFEYIENIVGGANGYSITVATTNLGNMGGANLFGGGFLLQDINVL